MLPRQRRRGTLRRVIERIEADLRAARLARDSGRVQALGFILNALQQEAKAKGGLADEAAVAVLRRERKRRDEAAASFREGGREADAAREEAEAALIDGYLPAGLSDEELAAIVAAAIAEVGATSPKEMGLVMKAAMPHVAGRADGKAVSAAVRAALAG